MITSRSAIHVFLAFFDREDDAGTCRAYDMCRSTVPKAGRVGYGEYRLHVSMMVQRTPQGRPRPQRHPHARTRTSGPPPCVTRTFPLPGGTDPRPPLLQHFSGQGPQQGITTGYFQ
jgi:hypothetical protein